MRNIGSNQHFVGEPALRGLAGVLVDLGEEVLGVPETVSRCSFGLGHVVGALAPQSRPSGSPRARTAGNGSGTPTPAAGGCAPAPAAPGRAPHACRACPSVRRIPGRPSAVACPDPLRSRSPPCRSGSCTDAAGRSRRSLPARGLP